MNIFHSPIGDNTDDEPRSLLGDLAIAVVLVQACIAIAYYWAGK